MEYEVGKPKNEYKIIIKDHILDNVYGQIGLTEVERNLELRPIFKRLHGISQLGLVNLIFPCALHTRYVHSIGVMYIASEMAMRINSNMGFAFFDDSDIQIIRLAGMLHDIGHYPMSHNVEKAYHDSDKKPKYDNEPVSDNLKHYVNCPDFLLPDRQSRKAKKNQNEETIKTLKLKEEGDFVRQIAGSANYHHENIGGYIISNNREIHDIIRNNFVLIKNNGKKILNPKFRKSNNGKVNYKKATDDEIDEITSTLLLAIAEMVRGNYSFINDKKYPWLEKYSAMIQLIHSDLDADNLDYLLRDATFSGTSYGIMDMGVLLNNMVVSTITNGKGNKKYIIGVKAKGIGCVEQFLINKFMAYSQMIMSKYVSILEAMLLKIEADCIIPKEKDYSCRQIIDMAKSKESSKHYIRFTDYYIHQKIFEMEQFEDSYKEVPQSIISHLRNSSAFYLCNDKEKECICTSNSEKEIQKIMTNSNIYKRFLKVYKKVKNLKGNELGELGKSLFSFRFETYSLTKQLPIEKFLDKFVFSEMSDDRRFNLHYYRLATGIPVLEEGREYLYLENSPTDIKTSEIPCLCIEHPRSSLRNLYSMKYVTLRQYNICEYTYTD